MNGRSQLTLALTLGLALGAAVSMTGDVLAERSAAAGAAAVAGSGVRGAAALTATEQRQLADIVARVKREYVEPVDDTQLVENAVRGMVAGLDPYSAFLDRDEYEEIRLSTSGSYPGIGVEVSAEDGGIMVLRTLEGSPAAEAGIRGGDMIVRIDDRPVGLDVESAIDQMRGEAGSIVRLGLRRPGATDTVELSLARARVQVHSVEHALLEPGFGYLRISTFSDTTPQDVEAAVKALVAEASQPLAGLVLDLRNNPGGVLESAVQVADVFLDRGVIVTAEGRAPDARFRMEATPGDLTGGARLAVLINGGSASAAEILAGALQDHHRATVVGRRSYGKGSVQTVIPLPDGRALKLTTSYYATPSGARINDRGIEPDLRVEGAEQPPAELDAVADSVELLQRDRELRVALGALKGSARLAALPVAASAGPRTEQIPRSANRP
jgi:carboxyl-terminal processing protease